MAADAFGDGFDGGAKVGDLGVQPGKGAGVRLAGTVFLDESAKGRVAVIRFGARVFANFGLVALDVAEITIGDDVQLGPNVQLLTPTQPLDPEQRRAKWEAAKPIAIESNAWLGGGAIVLPGATIGENAVVGAGAVVTKNVPANAVVVGNPARTHRQDDLRRRRGAV